ncbi:hypothetical protein B5X24_HaOG206648 [Helicoverpa armigera]|nr:hypothetical protein B5X24_HaOG206648 [Helicoverpa armigera]
MGDRDNNNLIPFIAGMVVGAGLLTLIYYKMVFDQPKNDNEKKKEKPKPGIVKVNQQINAPFKCTCKNGQAGPVSIILSSTFLKQYNHNTIKCRTIMLM